jgi:hypothetical protein
VDFSFGKEDETSGKERYAGGSGFDKANGVDPDFLTGENIEVSYLDRQYRDGSGRQADKYVGPQPGRAITPLPLRANERAENSSDQ